MPKTSAHALLPEDMEEASIDCMMTGEHGFTVPWAMWVDASRECWLHPKYTIDLTPFGTAVMRVELRIDGYHIWRVEGHRYQPSDHPGYVGSERTEFLSVVEIH